MNYYITTTKVARISILRRPRVNFIGLPGGDVNSSGSVTTADDSIIGDRINTSHYYVCGDLDLYGVVGKTGSVPNAM